MQRSVPRALVIGCGYLGSRVARSWKEAGFEVRATSRDPSRARALVPEGVSLVELDLENMANARLFETYYDVVLYSVAPGRDGNARLAFLDGALRVRERLEAHPPARLIYISSTGVYAQKDGSLVDEQSPAEPREERHRWIRKAEDGLRAAGVRPRATVLRLGGMYGPGRSPVEWMRNDKFRSRLGGSASAYMNWIHIDDAVAAVLAAAARGEPGAIYLVVDGSPVERGDFFAAAAELAGVEQPKLLPDPDDIGKRASNRRLREELGVVFRFPDYRRGLASLVT